MATIEHLNEIIDNIPNILQYFVPGVIFIMIIRSLSFKRFAENYTIVFSCVISYLFVSLIGMINELKIKSESLKEPIVISGIAVLIAILLAFFLSIIFNSKCFKDFTLKYFHKTLYDDIWQDVFDFKNGTNLKVYIKDKEYYIMGHYRFSEEKGEESWMALSAHTYRNKETNEIIGLDYSKNEKVLVTIRIYDIEHIEVF